MASSALSSSVAFAGRTLLSVPVLLTAASHLLYFSGVEAGLVARHLPHPLLVAVFVTLFPLVVALMVIAGFWTRVGALLMAVYLLPVTWVFRAGALLPLPELALHGETLWRSLSVVGGLLMVVAFGAGEFALRR